MGQSTGGKHKARGPNPAPHLVLSGLAPCFHPAALSSHLTVKEQLHLYSPNITFGPLKATARLMWPLVKMRLTPLVQRVRRAFRGKDSELSVEKTLPSDSTPKIRGSLFCDFKCFPYLCLMPLLLLKKTCFVLSVWKHHTSCISIYLRLTFWSGDRVASSLCFGKERVEDAHRICGRTLIDLQILRNTDSQKQNGA